MIAFVLGLAFILLVATFRSPRLALSVIGLNLLSVGAAFGVLVAVFQHQLGTVAARLPVRWRGRRLAAAVRVRGPVRPVDGLHRARARAGPRGAPAGRERQRGRGQALGSTGGTVTSAALVMIAVFSVFATLPLLEFKQLGVGLAAAIALDATIVRGRRAAGGAHAARRPRPGSALAHPAGARGAGIMESVSQRSDRAMTDHGHDIDCRSVVRGAAFTPPLVLLTALIVIWAATGAGYFWPMWAALGLAIPTGLWLAVRWARLSPRERLAGTRCRPASRWCSWRPAWRSGRCRAAAFSGRSSHSSPCPSRLPATRSSSGPSQRKLELRVDELHPHAQRRARRSGVRAAPDRARSARRRPGQAGRAQHAARARRGAAGRSSRQRGARAAGSRGGDRRDQRAAGPRARDRAAGARRPGPGRRGRVAREPFDRERRGGRTRSTTACRRWSRPPPTSSSPSR